MPHQEIEVALNDYSSVYYIAKFHSDTNKKIIFSDEDIKWMRAVEKEFQRLQDFLERKWNEHDG